MAQFPVRRSGWMQFDVQLEQHASDSLLEESLEILRSVTARQELFVYQTLTVWADQVATFSVRESLKKRQDKLLFQIREFPLMCRPMQIADTFAWAARQLHELTVPPGETQADRALFERLEERWLAIAAMDIH